VASILWTVVREVCCPGGTHRTLSRRDRMIVARQFIAWNTPKKGEPSRRDGVSRATRHIHRPWSKNVLSTESYRSRRDGFFVWHTPGNKLPGYGHSVPPGQRLSTPVHKFDARSLRVTGFEDEDDDEYEADCLLRLSRCRLERSGFLDHRCLFPDEPIKRRAVDAFGL